MKRRKNIDAREVNAQMNRFAREANKYNIGSPYRISEYIKYRMQGMSEKVALEKSREGRVPK